MSPRIAAVICTYNRYDVLPKAIHSLTEQTLATEKYRIMVVDNSPDREYAEKIRSQYKDNPQIEYHIESIPGLSNARNVSAKQCGTEFIAYMDDDAIATPGWLENVLTAFDLFGKDAAVVGGRVDPMWEVERPSWLDDSLLGYVSAVNWGGETRVVRDGEWLAGTNISFRTQDVLDAGGFDTSLGRKGGGTALMSNEEIGLLNHLKESGKLAIYAPEAVVSHLVERKRLKQSWFRQRIVWQAVSDYMMHPETAIGNATAGWEWVLEYFFRLPPKERNIRGLFYKTDSPQQFGEQLSVLSAMATLMLAGFADVENEGGRG